MARNNVLSEETSTALAEKKKILDHQKHQLKQLKDKLHEFMQQNESDNHVKDEESAEGT